MNCLRDQHVHYKWHVLVISVLFMSSPEPPVYISSVVSFPMWSGGSVMYFPFHLGVGGKLYKGSSYILGIGIGVFFGMFCGSGGHQSIWELLAHMGYIFGHQSWEAILQANCIWCLHEEVWISPSKLLGGPCGKPPPNALRGISNFHFTR